MRLSVALQKFVAWKNFDSKSGTIKGYSLYLKQFTIFMRNCDIEDVTVDHVLEWFTLMNEMGYDHNSMIPKAIALRKLFEFHTHNGLHVMDPWLIPVPDKQYKIPRVAGEEEYNKIMAIIPQNNDARHIRNRAIISLLWDTGARNGEICSLNVNDMDYERRRAVIHTEKNKGSRPVREIFWTPKSNDHLLHWMEKREYLTKKMQYVDDKAMFVCVASGGIHFNGGKRLQTKGVGEMLRRYSHRAGIPILNAHSFRHHMGHHIVNRGGSNSDVSNILGHSSLQSSYIYTQMNNRELEERYKKFMDV